MCGATVGKLHSSAAARDGRCGAVTGTGQEGIKGLKVSREDAWCFKIGFIITAKASCFRDFLSLIMNLEIDLYFYSSQILSWRPHPTDGWLTRYAMWKLALAIHCSVLFFK